MSEKQRFQEIIQELRSDLIFVQELQTKLSKVLIGKRLQGKEFGKWVTDVYIDKVLETNSKINHFLSQLGVSSVRELNESNRELVNCLQDVALKTSTFPYLPINSASELLAKVKEGITNFNCEFEKAMVLARTRMYNTNWTEMKKIQSEDYVLMERNSYLTARQELEKAKDAVKNRQWAEVLNHLRPAIDLAMKEKFGFKKINPMKQFLIDAEKFGLQLPTYTMLYDYFDEGSQRIHSGKLNTPYECQKALEFVAGFIDQLDLIDIKKGKIEEFKQKCKCVE